MPTRFVELAENTVLVTVTSPPSLSIAPPVPPVPKTLRLFERTQSVRVTLPAEWIVPPAAAVLSVKVQLGRLKVAFSRTRSAPPAVEAESEWFDSKSELSM